MNREAAFRRALELGAKEVCIYGDELDPWFPDPLSSMEMEGIVEAVQSYEGVHTLGLNGALRNTSLPSAERFLRDVFTECTSLKCISITNGGNGNSLAQDANWLAKVIGNLLRESKTVTCLEFPRNNIGCVGAMAVAKGLAQNIALVDVNLCKNEIGSRGAKALANTLLHNNALRKLNLKRNCIGISGAKSLGPAVKASKLKVLDVSFNPLQDEGGKHVVSALKCNNELETLNMRYTRIGDETCRAFATALRTNRRVTCVDMACNAAVTYEGSAAVLDSLEVSNYTLRQFGVDEHNDVLMRTVSWHIDRALGRNKFLTGYADKVTFCISEISPTTLPIVLSKGSTKYDFIYSLLKAKADCVCCLKERKGKRRIESVQRWEGKGITQSVLVLKRGKLRYAKPTGQCNS